MAKKVKKAKFTDIRIAHQGSIFTFTPLNNAAREWIKDHVDYEDWQWNGRTLVVDHRYGFALAVGFVDAGFTVRDGDEREVRSSAEIAALGGSG